MRNRRTSRRNRLLMALASAAALRHGLAGAADTPAAGEAAPSVVVSGQRASLVSARRIKLESIDIVDSVVASDIQKLPDFSVTDALQRITGVQVARDRGEGANAALRGLTQMETTLNGREVFTAGTGRNLDFADIPAELLAGVDVYKSASAGQIEGGVGGTIDLRTRRPFDFGAGQRAASARVVRSELARRERAQFSLLASERWRGAGGEFGALLNLSRQRRAWREDQSSVGAPTVRRDLVAGQAVIAPNGATETASVGERERDAASAVLQWRPWPGLELYAEGGYAQLRTLQDSHQITLEAGPRFVAGSAALFPGTADLRGITWTGARASILSFARDTLDRNRTAALGGNWRRGALSVKADASHSASHNQLYFAGPVLNGTAATFAQDLAGRAPSARVAGAELLDPANLRLASIAYRTRPFDGRLNAARLDAEYVPGGGWIDALAAGVRYASRGAGNAPGLVFGDTALAGMAATERPGLLAGHPYPAFFPGTPAAATSNYLVGNLATARDAQALRRAAGIDAPLPVAGGALGVWRIREHTASAHLMARFAAAGLPLDGHAGVRMVRTRESVRGSQSVPSGAGIAPIDVGHGYTDYLPSMALRYRLGERLVLRGAASKTLTRPNFDQLSPSLSLVPNSITPAANQGSAGNPELAPVRSDNLDLALERYTGQSGLAHLTLFHKRVDGFVGTAARTEIHDGAAYLVSRPYNNSRARIRGAELGYQEFFDFLPGRLKGLGLQANYTFIDSATPSSLLGGDVPLQNLSRHSANLIGMYEHGGVSARVAYNWRAKFLSGINNVVGLGALPVYTKAYGWLDASLACQLTPQLTLSVEGGNLLRTVRSAYYGVETRPQSAWVNDRQFSVTALLRF